MSGGRGSRGPRVGLLATSLAVLATVLVAPPVSPALSTEAGPAATARDGGAGGIGSGAAIQERLDIVSTLPAYSAIARELVGDLGSVKTIADPRQDAHFVQAKPSYSIMVGQADLLITTGLDLELWIPAVIDRSRNPEIREGEVGYVAVASGVPMLQVPDNPSRAGGDIHVYGNPHVHTDPLRAVIIADNILTGLENVDPEHRSTYRENFRAFQQKIHRRLFGDELVGLVGGDKLADLAMQNRLWSFLQETEIGGRPLAERLGGWMAQAECVRGKRIVAYHLNWIYFTDRFGIDIAGYVERRPGIPPSASHVAGLVEMMRREEIGVLWVANYYDRQVPELIAQRTGAQFLYVPLYPGGAEGTDDYTSLVDAWIRDLRAAFPDCEETEG